MFGQAPRFPSPPVARVSSAMASSSNADKELILKLTASFLAERADSYKDGWLLDKIIPKVSVLNKGFHENAQVRDYVRRRRAEFAEFPAGEWKEYNNEYEDRAAWTADSLPQCKQRPLLSWGLGSIVTFLGR